MYDVRLKATASITPTLVLVGVLALLALPSSSRADEGDDQARKLNTEAKKQFNLGNFSEAAALYKKAYEAKPIPEFLHNVAQCYKRMAALEYLEKALFYFESYLNNAPDSPNRQDVEAEIAEIKHQIESLRKGGVKAGAEKAHPASSPARVAPPAALPPTATSTPHQTSKAEPRQTPIYKRWWFWTVVGAAIVGGTVGAAIAATTGGSNRMPSGPDGRWDPLSFGQK
jgi:tetratricopeptide (TPR) repeat protein